MKTKLHLGSISLCLLAISALAGTCASADGFPSGPVKIITAQAAGQGNDVLSRIVADHLGRIWGQQVTVVNQPGAGGAIAARSAAAAPPDGHTLFMAIASVFVSLPVTQPNLPFDVNEFVPIDFIGEVPMAIAVSPAASLHTLEELITQSKKQPSGLDVALGARGGIPHLTAELFASRSGAKLTMVHYAGSGQAAPDLITGRVPITVEGLAGPNAGGQLKLLAVATRERLASRPDVPTVAEALPGFSASAWSVMVAPRGTPAAIVNKLRSDLHSVLARPDLRGKFADHGTLLRRMSPQELGKFILSEQQLWKPIVTQALLSSK